MRRASFSKRPLTKLEGPAGKGGRETGPGRRGPSIRSRRWAIPPTQGPALLGSPTRGIPQVCPPREILGGKNDVLKTKGERALSLPPGALDGGRQGEAPEPPPPSGGILRPEASPRLSPCACGLLLPHLLGFQTAVWLGFPPPRSARRRPPRSYPLVLLECDQLAQTCLESQWLQGSGLPHPGRHRFSWERVGTRCCQETAWRHHTTRVRSATRGKMPTQGAGTRRPRCLHPSLTGVALRPIWRRAPSARQCRTASARAQPHSHQGWRRRPTKGGDGITARPRLPQSGRRPEQEFKRMKGNGAKQRGPGPSQTGNKPEPKADGTNPRLAHPTRRDGERCPGARRQLDGTPIPWIRAEWGANSG